jgi:hypothetical protein
MNTDKTKYSSWVFSYPRSSVAISVLVCLTASQGAAGREFSLPARDLAIRFLQAVEVFDRNAQFLTEVIKLAIT